MIALLPRHLKLVIQILNIHLHCGQKVYVFGSRANNTAGEFSDLDLCIDGEFSFDDMASLKENFSESDLPYFVDIIRKDNLSDEFYALIKPDLLVLPF